MAPPTAQLDHVVLLLPYDDIVTPPAWLTQNFTISPGGQHADGKTENRLVLFRDGTYLELIAFIDDDPEKRRGHWWDKPFGVIDFALTTASPLDYASLATRLEKSGTEVRYADPKDGGRRTPDGKELKWKVTFPEGTPRGSVPFWCHDVTPRERRVPVTEANTTHPSGVLGMAGVLQEVKGERTLDRLSSATSAILDVPRHAGGRYEVGVPHHVSDALKAPSVRLQRTRDSSSSSFQDSDFRLTLILQTPEHNPLDEIRQRIGDGVVAINFE